MSIRNVLKIPTSIHSQSLDHVEVITATCDIEEIRFFRCAPKQGNLRRRAVPLHPNTFHHRCSNLTIHPRRSRFLTFFSWAFRETRDRLSRPQDRFFHTPQGEIGPACLLYVFLLTPLLSSIVSCCVLALVHSCLQGLLSRPRMGSAYWKHPQVGLSEA